MIDFSRSTFTWHSTIRGHRIPTIGMPAVLWETQGQAYIMSDSVSKPAAKYGTKRVGMLQKCLSGRRVVASTRLRPETCSKFPVVSGAWLSAMNPS